MSAFDTLSVSGDGLLGLSGVTIDLIRDDLEAVGRKLPLKIRVINPTTRPPYYGASYEDDDLRCHINVHGSWPMMWTFTRRAIPAAWDEAAEERLLRFYEKTVVEMVGQVSRTYPWGSVQALYDDKSGSSYILILVSRASHTRQLSMGSGH